jgi:drug/metabolite transporter (DMT)-like permease
LTLVAVLGGWLFLKESVLAVQIVGGVVMLLGLYLMRRGRR